MASVHDRATAGSFICALLLAAASLMPLSAQPPTELAKRSIELLSPDSIYASIQYLGDDALLGRGAGSEGLRRAAEYLAAKLKHYGVAPTNGGYFQNVPMHASRPRDCRLLLHYGDTTKGLALWEDYLLYTMGAGTTISKQARMVFAGYGIVAPEYDYNDYYEQDVEGAIVVFLEGEPISRNTSYFEGSTPTHHSFPAYKQRVALSRGAAGSIMIPLFRVSGETAWEEEVRRFSFEHVQLLSGPPENLAVLMNPSLAGRLFDESGFSLEDVYRMDSLSNIRSFPLRMEASFEGRFFERDFVDRNVIGFIPGSDPLLKDNYLILSAHYDHLGTGMPVQGDSIYNGVADNAMGTAVLLEMARVLAQGSYKPARSILVIFLTAEERGLLGSQYYCENPIVALHKTIANVNIDGVAMFDTFNDAVGIGAELSTIGDHLKTAAAQLGLSMSPVPDVFQSSEPFVMSDQLVFAQAGIPSILVMEGLQYRHHTPVQALEKVLIWSKTRYHTPFDDLKQRIHYPAVVQHAALLTMFAAVLADTWSPPEWLPGSRYVNARLRSMVEGR